MGMDIEWRNLEARMQMSDTTVDEQHEQQQEAAESQETDVILQSDQNVVEEDQAKRSPEMDEDDIAEMSMIAAEIESAEDFNLTFETIETSVLHEEQPKSKGRRRSLKDSSPLYVSEQQEIEEFLEEGINQSVVEEANVSVAEALLDEWGSPKVDAERSTAMSSLSSRKRKSWEEESTIPSTPKGRQPLRELLQNPSSNRKRLSDSSIEGDALSPRQERRSSTSKSEERKRTSSISKKGKVLSPKQILKARNV